MKHLFTSSLSFPLTCLLREQERHKTGTDLMDPARPTSAANSLTHGRLFFSQINRHCFDFSSAIGDDGRVCLASLAEIMGATCSTGSPSGLGVLKGRVAPSHRVQRCTPHPTPLMVGELPRNAWRRGRLPTLRSSGACGVADCLPCVRRAFAAKRGAYPALIGRLRSIGLPTRRSSGWLPTLFW